MRGNPCVDHAGAQGSVASARGWIIGPMGAYGEVQEPLGALPPCGRGKFGRERLATTPSGRPAFLVPRLRR